MIRSRKPRDFNYLRLNGQYIDYNTQINLYDLYVDVLTEGALVKNSGRLGDGRICIKNLNAKYAFMYRQHYLIGVK